MKTGELYYIPPCYMDEPLDHRLVLALHLARVQAMETFQGNKPKAFIRIGPLVELMESPAEL